MVPLLAAGFLNSYWRDVWTVVGVVGVILTAAGFVAGLVALRLAWRQVSEAVTAAQAAATAARATQAANDRLILSLANRVNAETRLLVSSERFEAAAMKCSDVADFLTLLTGRSDAWRELADEVREMSEQFRRIGAGEIKYPATLQAKWSRLSVRVGRDLSVGLAAPNPPPEPSP